VKESWELSTKLEFDGFDDIVANGGHPEGEGTNQPLSEVVEDGESESKSRMESKPPAFGEYKVEGAQSRFASCRIVLTGCHSLNLKLPFFVVYVACRRSPTFSPATLRKFRNPRFLRIDHEIVAGNNEKWTAGRAELPADSSSLDISAAGTGVA